MSAEDIFQIQATREILKGYETWRDNKLYNRDNSQLGIEAYLEELEMRKALERVKELRQVYSDPELAWQEVDAEVRRILGVEQ